MEYLLIIIVVILWWYHYKKYLDRKYKNTNKILLDSINNYEKQLQETREKFTIKLWTVYKHTDEDLQKLKINKEALDIVVKILTYYTATATDALRSQMDTNKLLTASGNVSWFHEMLVFFWKLQQEANKQVEK